MSVLYGGFEEWVVRGYPIQPAGPEWQIGLSPVAATAPAPAGTAPTHQEAAAALNPLDDSRDAGL